jgi:hypothetical protein
MRREGKKLFAKLSGLAHHKPQTEAMLLTGQPLDIMRGPNRSLIVSHRSRAKNAKSSSWNCQVWQTTSAF